MTDSHTPRLPTRRTVLRRSGSLVSAAGLVGGTASAGQPTPSAAELTLRPADIPWDFEPYELPLELADSVMLRGITSAVPSLATRDTAYVDYVRDEWPRTPHVPEVCNLVVVGDEELDRETVIRQVSEWVTDNYGSTLPECFEPITTVRRTTAGAHWLYELSMPDTMYRVLYSCQCVGGTVFLTNLRAYADQYDVRPAARHVDHVLRRRRREWVRNRQQVTDG